jgi:uncharacterized LabA/DUF88 family protein
MVYIYGEPLAAKKNKGGEVLDKTLILYDVENLKVPPNSTYYAAKRIDFRELSYQIKNRYKSLFYKELAFVKDVPDDDRRKAGVDGFFSFLASIGIRPIRKMPKKKKVSGVYQGRKYVHCYEKCDMDTMIAEEIVFAIGEYDHIILLSGDADMAQALKRAQKNNIEVTVIAHKENMSSIMKKFDWYAIDKVLEGIWEPEKN